MPPKLGFIEKSRAVIDFWMLRFPWPKISPNLISYLALPFSLVFIFLWRPFPLLALIILMIVLFLDWLDGLVAKKYHLASEKGWLVDVATDRFSEGIIFAYFFHPWFYFFVANVILTFISYKVKRHIFILPLRQAFFLYLIVYYSFYYYFSR